jgi:hypothetical protein
MMSTWASLLSDLRTDLKDTGAAPRFSNAALFVYAKDAIRDYSFHFPSLVARRELVKENGSFLLPSNFLRDVEVEYPIDNYLQKRMESPGTRYFSKKEPTLYHLSGNRLLLNGPADEVFLTYHALYDVPAAHDNLTFELGIPLLDEELIRLYVKAKALETVRSQTSNLDRFKIGNGSRDDNPLEPEVANLMQEYRLKIAERTLGGAILLYRYRGPQ